MVQFKKRFVFMKSTMLLVLLMLLFFVSGCAERSVEDSLEWRCNAVECLEFMDGYQWAEMNCFIDGNRTVCPVEFEGQRLLVPVEQIDLDGLAECVSFVCVEEVPYREVEYEIDVS